MADFVIVAGAGPQLTGLMIPVATGGCGNVLVGIQAVHDQVVGAGDTVASCSVDPVVPGAQIVLSTGVVWTVSSTGTFNGDGFVADAFDPAIGGALFASVVSSVLILYVCSRSAGTILNFVRGR